MLKLFKRSSQLEQQVMGINERNRVLIYKNNPRKYYQLADDKVRCKQILDKNGLACAPTYAVIERIGDIESAWQQVQQYDNIAIKPANGSGGGGILILKKNANGIWYKSGKPIDSLLVFKHFANILMGIYSLGDKDRVLIEQCIIPHPFFYEIYPAGVPDFRIILLKQNILMGMLRLPTDKSDGKANLHQGGLGVGVDLETGLLKQAFDGKKYWDIHPDNGAQILDKPIPYWEEILTLSIATAKSFPLDYLGVDLVIDKDLGPLIMEINVRPGLGIQLANKSGLKSALKNLKN